MTSSSAPPSCPLAYPDKFHAAAKFWKLQPKGAKTLSQENQLLLYALNQQATVGPNTTPRPWGWNVVDSTKWQGWKELGQMTTVEAMRLFVRIFDEDQPDWWALLQETEAAAEANGTAPCPPPDPADASVPLQPAVTAAKPPPRSVAERAVLGLWTQLEVGVEGGGKKPLPRYESAAAVVGDKVYVLGGNYGGRYLSDVWVLDLATAAWSPLQLQAAAAEGAPTHPAFPPTAGHTATPWEGKLYVLGGHTKAKGSVTMSLWVVDPATHTVEEPQTSGQAPPARGGHTATLLGSKLWVFGGEDSSRRALSDVHVLDLQTLTWSTPEIEGAAPLGRSASCATGFLDRYIIVFGGGSIATCFNDVHVLDTQTLTWSQPAQAGAKVTPRAGHAGVVLGDIWYIVGGGNNVKGCTDLLAADLSALEEGTITWHVVTSVAVRDPLSSEGISLVVLPADRVMLAFGGYNGKYQNAVSLFRAPMGSAALLAGAAAAAATAVEEQKQHHLTNGEAAAAAKSAAPAEEEEPAAAAPSPPAPPAAPVDPVTDLRQQVSELKSQLEGARREAESAIREAAAAKESAAHELALLRKQLSTAQASLAEANKALEDSRASLAAEQTKVLKLEAQSAELQAKLGQVAELERELDKYRRAAKEAEAAAKKSGGLWSYIAGGGSSSS